jgi:WD40 repeat protein/energy-coupling factor transporter ATP-binding protein EcfA2
VGINSYQTLPGLKAPAKDAEAIAQMLQNQGEFRVHRLPEIIQAGKPCVGQKTQVTLQELESALIKLFKPQGHSVPHTALFYFSGHGIQREAGIREGYLATSDSQPTRSFYGLSLFWLRRLLQESPVRQRIIWLDCCHSGELLNFLEADPGAKPGTDRLFMAASREYETAYESIDSPYSIFTQALLTGLDSRRLESGIVTNHALTDWVNHSLKGEIQQPLFESSGSEIILTRCNTVKETVPLTKQGRVQSAEICPYRGLEFFDETHAEFFFGRESLTAQLLEKVQTDRFVAVVGASGSGKSSLIRAGLIAQLRQLTEDQSHPTPDWRIKLLTPGETPLKNLAAVFIDPDLSELERAEQLRRAELFLHEGASGLAQLVRASLPLPTGTTGLLPQPRSRLLLVIDQFEEVFTLTQGSQAERDRQQFLHTLLGAAQMALDCLTIVVVLRTDFLSKCAQYAGLADQIEQHRITVNPLKYEQIKTTIVRPAQKVGLVCEPNLVYTMLLDVIGAPGELPLLQYTLLELWQHRRLNQEGNLARLTLDSYRELGGIRGTLQKRATKIFHQLSAEEQPIAKRIFLSLTQLGEGTEDTRRRVPKSQLVSPVFSMELVEQVLEKLVAAKLLVTNQTEVGVREKILDQSSTCNLLQRPLQRQSISEPGYQEIVDVAHETLIRHWSLLRDWLDENREVLQRQRRIEQAAQEWDRAGQPLSGEFLLHGLRLRDAEDFVLHYAQELSALAQEYIAISREAMKRARRESRQLRFAIPAVLAATLIVVLGQYYGAIRSQAEKDQQLQQATAREQAAIAKTVLQDKSSPTTALLISRLAATQTQTQPTAEVQTSLREALQNLRLQFTLKGHQGTVAHTLFSLDRQTLATAGTDGTVRLWSINANTVYNIHLEPTHILSGSASLACASNPNCESVREASAPVTAIAFSPDGQFIAAAMQNSAQIKIWSVRSGAMLLQLNGSAAVTQMTFSPNGQWIATAHADQSLALWRTDNGQLQVHLNQPTAITSLQFSPNGQNLLAGTAINKAQRWKIIANPNQTVTLQKIQSLAHPQLIRQAKFSSLGRWIVTLSEAGKARLWNGITGQLIRTFEATPLSQIQFSPDDRTLAITNPGTNSETIQLWDLRSGQLHQQLAIQPGSVEQQSSFAQDFPNQISSLSFSPNGQFLATLHQQSGNAKAQQIIQLWDLKTGRSIGTLPQDQPITTMQFSPDNTYLVTGGTDGVVRFWSSQAGGELPTIALSDKPMKSAAFMKNAGSQLVMLAANGQLQQWQFRSEAMSETPVQQKPIPLTAIYRTTIQPRNFWQDLRSLLTKQNRSAQPATRQAVGAYDVLSPSLTKMQMLAPIVSQVAAASVEPQYQSLTASKLNPRDIQSLQDAAFSPDGKFLATSQADGMIKIQQLLPNGTLRQIRAIQSWRSSSQTQTLSHDIHRLSFSLDGKYLLGIGGDLTVRSWEVQSGQLLQVLRGHKATIQQARFSPDGQWIVTASWDKTVRIWEAQSGQLVRVFQHDHAVNSANFSPDSQQIVTASWDAKARVFNAATGQQLLALAGHDGSISDAQFSPDGESIVTASLDSTAILWNAQTGAQQALLNPAQPGTANPLLQAFFSPDGQYIATLSKNGQVYLWIASWNTLLKLAHDRSIRQLTSEECDRYLRLMPEACPKLPIENKAS